MDTIVNIDASHDTDILGGYSEYNYLINKRAIEIRKIVGPCRLKRPFKYYYQELVLIAVAEHRLSQGKKLSFRETFALECWKVYNGQSLEETIKVISEPDAKACHYRWVKTS
jgi:hypothetical protein